MADIGDVRSKALIKARQLQNDANLIAQNEREEEALLGKLEEIADQYHDLLGMWEGAGDTQMAEQVRKEEERMRQLITRLTELADRTAEEAKKVLGEVKDVLRNVNDRPLQ